MRRLTILLAAVGALLVVPAAHAATGVEPLKVKLTGTGSGKAFISPEISAYKGDPTKQINCTYASPGPQSGTCETLMSDEGAGWEQVYVAAEAGPESKFVGWTVKNTEFEACSPTGAFPACAPFVEPPGTGSGEAEIIVTFEHVDSGPRFRVSKLGEGTVVSNPAGIYCPPTCEAQFGSEAVTLTASPAADWAFHGWSGCDISVGLKCTLTVGSLRTVMATFVSTPLLTVEKAGTGYGKVITTGISCDESCSKSTAGIKTGTPVTVKAVAARGSEFAGFEGGTGNASSCSATCAFTISEKSSVKVKFSPIPTKTLTVNVTGPGAYKGKVSGKGTAVKGAYSTTLSCGAGCTSAVDTFFATRTTELVATAATGYSFKGWTVEGGTAGTCTGTTTPCALLTDADKTVKAEFE